MAYATDLNTRAQNSFGARFSSLIVDLKARMARRSVYKTTLRELSSLSDRELNDLGLSRSMIRRVAYQAAYEM
ncbi:DUF1127 domain-containing protein [Tropicibacter oceani]|uniref:DUF1127 domain-containing protein n=1 Tax=Tropicibacter oceani TaxID=3058420 RepID=A0ABY8QCV3_9RHOB|nr:DUF1127 domain-containing protein [Tropicibacter oceani]WGW02319.1 DUF1127 domain-containing protein [Tropicibacter oceani]